MVFAFLGRGHCSLSDATYGRAAVAEAPKIDRDRCAKAQTILRFWPPRSVGKELLRRPWRGRERLRIGCNFAAVSRKGKDHDR